MRMIFKERNRISRLLCIVLIIGCLLVTGCVHTPKKSDETSSDVTENIADANDNTEATVNTESNEEKEAASDTSLISFRQSMVETPQLFAVAYFGYSTQESADAAAFMQKSAPKLCEDLPFLLSIPEERIIGTSGELFCIVPSDENATVAVNKKNPADDGEDHEYTEVVYRSENSDPILLFCNNGDLTPDTQITITNSDGTVTVWHPSLDSSYHAAPVCNENGEELFLDFSHYDELSTEDPNALG